MTLKLLSAAFEDTSLGVHGTRTEDGSALSVLFDDLVAESQGDDVDAVPQVRRAEGVVQCEGRGWVAVQVRGSALVAGAHGFAHATGWANGRRLRAMARGVDEPFCAAVSAPVGADGRLRISLLLLAQRDLASSASGSLCVLDSIDIAVLPPRRARQADGAVA